VSPDRNDADRLAIHSTEALAAAAGQQSVQRHDLGDGTFTTTVLFTGPAGPARPHVHRHHDEVCVLLSGSGTITVGGETRPMSGGDVIIIPAGQPHGATFDEPFRMLSVYGPTDDPSAPDRQWVEL
jgi:quercetin dioxygenase-like cupin family protein